MQQQLDAWEQDFTAFHARFGHVFRRSEPREQCCKYLRGLLAKVERKNCWQLAETLGEATPDATQRMLYQAQWDADAARDILQDFVAERFGDAHGIAIVDETGFVKKGTRSVGVQRQYSGTAGKIENCQVGVFLSYVSPRGHALVDRRLYLPQEWCQDRERRQQARVPEDIEFRTKPQLALQMVQQARQRGVPMRWIAGDEVYGEAGYFRQKVAQERLWYVLAVSVSTPVWRRRPPLAPRGHPARGGAHTRVRLAPEAPPTTTVGQVVAGWPQSRWRRLEVAQGEKGPRVYDWAAQRVVETQQGAPGQQVWLLARRSVSDASDIAYYLSNAPGRIPLSTLAQVASARWSIEQCFEEAKGQTGLDQYEVRYWHSWHRHITLSMMAHAWLASVRSALGGKKGPCTTSWPK